MTLVDVRLPEWSSRDPETLPCLRQLNLGDRPARELAVQLSEAGSVVIRELAQGLQVESYSQVGSIVVGPLRIAIRPKLAGNDLLRLLRYAYGLRHLDLFDSHEQPTADIAFPDLLLHQFAAEVMELLARGLHRHYVPRYELLPSPKGRISFEAMATPTGMVAATLPCRYHPRLEDCPHNQVLLAGLSFGLHLVEDARLRNRLRQLSHRLGETVSPQPLKRSLLQQVQREASRLTHAYRPALSLVALLQQSASVSPAGTGERVTVSGFLFDMNLFWQELMERFLTEYLVGARVESQYHLRGLLTYLQGFNPRNRPAPVPRPDYVITQKGRVTAILDAKYRDLWERTLPRDMMYQLLVYALSHRGCTEATMLYPTTAESAREAKIELRDPIRGSGRATVVLRPVFLPYLPTLLSDRRTSAGQQRCADYAHYLAFGKSETRPSLL